MEGKTTIIEEAKIFFDRNFIGVEELELLRGKMGIKIPPTIPEFTFDLKQLKLRINPKDYFLILSVPCFEDGTPISILGLRNFFGIDPDMLEPCFYNQDWYLKEDFAKTELDFKWNILSKGVIEASRGLQPDILSHINPFPTAILCAYTFLIAWFYTKEILWKNDYVWCNDKDHNGDRIYVGGYQSSDGINKNGFEIHRHLSIKKSYGAIDNISL